MKFVKVLSSLILAAVVSGLPVKRADEQGGKAESGSTEQGPTDLDFIQFILSLEHIEAELYRQGLQNFTEDAFAEAGFKPDIRARYEQIVDNEKVHVDTLTSALFTAGVQPVPECTYSFPVTTIEEFLDLTHTFENVASSALNGVLALLQNPTTTSLVGGALSLEARQSAWIGSTVLHQNPWNVAFETPLSARQIYTVARASVVACPQDFPSILGFQDSFPALEVEITHPTATFKFEQETDTGTLFAAFLQGADIFYAPIDVTGEVKLPEGLNGYFWALVTEQQEGQIEDDLIVAGPTILNFPFDSQGRLISETE